MNEVIVFPDAEALAVNYLKSLVNVPVSTKVPATRPASFVKVTRVGGSKVRLNTDSPMLVFECWDTSSVNASALCSLIRAYVHAMPGNHINGEWIYKVTEVGGPAYFPDPQTETPRYQFTVTIDVKGVVME